MGFRFRKSFKVFPGIRINVSKSGVSTSVSVPGATVNLGRGRVTTTAGLPGTGLSYRTSRKLGAAAPAGEAPAASGAWWLLKFILALGLLMMAVCQLWGVLA